MEKREGPETSTRVRKAGFIFSRGGGGTIPRIKEEVKHFGRMLKWKEKTAAYGTGKEERDSNRMSGNSQDQQLHRKGPKPSK